MSVDVEKSTDTKLPEPSKRYRRRHKPSVGNAMLARGEPMVWLTGGALAFSLLMIVALLALVFYLGSGTFYPVRVHKVELFDGRVFMGEITKDEEFTIDAQGLASEPEAITTAAVEKFLAEIGDEVDVVGRIPQELEAINAEAADREAYLVDRLAGVEQRVDELREQLLPEGDSAFARADHIRAFGDVEEYDNAHAFMLTLQNELDATRARQETNAKAIAYFQEHGSQSQNAAALILSAPYAEKIAGLEALLRIKADLDGTRVARGHRRQFRTGNYQLTGTHFNWVSDYEIKPEAETLPDWALVIERRTWGRFYGLPVKFTEARIRELPEAETNLVEAETFFAAHPGKLGEAEQEALDQTLQDKREQLATEVNQSVEAFVAASQDREDATELIAVGADGQQFPVDELPEAADVRQMIEVYEGEQLAFEKFQLAHANALDRHVERKDLEEHDIGEQNLRQENARLAVRQSEINADSQGALEIAKRMSVLAGQVAMFERNVKQAEATAAQIKQAYSGTAIATAADEVVAALREQTRQQTADLQQQLAAFAEDGEAMEGVPATVQQAIRDYVETEISVTQAIAEIQQRINEIKKQDAQVQLVMRTAQDQEKEIELGEIVRAYPANQLDFTGKAGVYLSRVWEFLSDDPREANSEGGVFPAIWGTIAMTLIMSMAVAPFGVLAALYLREYAKAGPIVSVIRISINNLAGVPSIVFGVFGLGFFCYGVGKWIDGGPENLEIAPLAPTNAWIAMGLSAVIAVGAFAVHLVAAAGHPGTNRLFKKVMRSFSFMLWLAATFVLVVLIVKFPFSGFYAANLPNPTFGTGGILWASLTLALLTLPVVIVATEEALAAVPNSMREGSYGCGASKWQTIRRIVLPHALPGIMTGMILAMARGAGEVAPLMLVGAVKLAPELPLDMQAPFLHLERSFMHLGFHIFDLGFQSQNSEAAKPMVFTTTLLLIVIIACLNVAAVWLRGMLRKRFQRAQF